MSLSGILSPIGCSLKMTHYYSHWERNIYKAVLTMLCDNLSSLFAAIESETGNPLFSIDSILSVPEIVIHPPGPEIYKMYTNTVRKTALLTIMELQ